MSALINPNILGDENELQRHFYERIGINPDLSHNTDGVFEGCLFENKLNIQNVNRVLSQAIKYASRIRIRGEKLPANIILNDLVDQKVYIFKSKDFIKEIEKVYFGPASKDNDNFTTTIEPVIIDYSDYKGLSELLEYVKQNGYIKYNIDKTNIIGLSQQFYKVNQDKDKFIKGDDCEIRKPTILNDRINPYTGEDNIEFEDIMDCLNPALLQREQGAFYTPVPYVQEMQKMLNQAISEIPDGMDYIIIDRCAGTGNLEEGLSDEVLSHCVLSTIEYNEYAILNYKYGDKCLVVIPNIDALAYDIIPAEVDMMNTTINDFIRTKIKDDNTVIILMENPPFSEVAAGSVQNTGNKKNLWKQSFVCEEMKKDVSGVVSNDLTNLFIWSGFKFYLRKPTDSFILYSPTKYWRNQELANKRFRGGFLCNRKMFHADDSSAIGCIWWQNIEDNVRTEMELTPYDISGNKIERAYEDIILKKAFTTYAPAFDKRVFPDDKEDGIICERDGTEMIKPKKDVYVKPRYNKNIIGYLCASNFQIDRKDVILTRCGVYKGHGFFIRNDNFIEKLPLFVGAVYPYDKWYFTNVYSKSYDGNGRFLMDIDFLKSCLIYTSLAPKNKCRSFKGSDGRFYKNELCFHQKDTLAYKKLEELLKQGCELSLEEKNLMTSWDFVIGQTQTTDEYKNLMSNPDVRLGLWQIKEEINIKVDSGKVNKKGKPIMKYKTPMLNTAIRMLEDGLKNYYNKVLIPKLFEYELLK